ncbi:MAG: sigma-70 family RNA polymerase sigma factor [Candidatus Sulfotelmatobacter sp.]
MTANSTQLAVREGASDDLDLIHTCKNGDVTAFDQLVKRYERRLLLISQTVTHNREDSEDAVQEALLKAFQNLANFREDSQFSTWLIRITVNQSLMKLRKQRTHREVSLDEDFQANGNVLPLDVPDRAPNPEQLCWASELRDILVKTVEELRPILQTVFVLRDIQGLSIDQTAKALNVSHAAVKARLWRVRLHLRERLNKYLNERTSLAPEELAPTNRVTKKIIGLFAECLRDSIPQTYSTSLAR